MSSNDNGSEYVSFSNRWVLLNQSHELVPINVNEKDISEYQSISHSRIACLLPQKDVGQISNPLLPNNISMVQLECADSMLMIAAVK